MNHKEFRLTAAFLLGIAGGMAIASSARRRSFSFHGRTVVITGGSRGLGLVLAREFARDGARLALLARDENELARAKEELAQRGATVLTVPCDLRDREQVNSAIQRIVDEMGRIDVLVNNAGVIQVGPFAQMSEKDFEDAMAIHFWGPLFVTWAVLPHMRRAGGGRVVNITSIGGKIAFPHLLPYTASKFALVGLSDGLRAELRRENILVTTVCPGAMRTGSPRNALFKGQHRKEYAWFVLADSLPLFSISAERAARKIVSACRGGHAQLVLGFPAKAAVLFHEWFPETTATALALTNRLLPKAQPGAADSRAGRQSVSSLAPSFLTRLTQRAAIRNNQCGAAA